MENLSELQNPLLDKNSKHMVNGYGGDFPNSQYKENIINYFAGGGGGGEGGGGGGKANNGNVVSGGGYNANGKVKSQQLLDATSLHLAVEAFYRPNFILYKEDSGSIKAKEYKSECCETTFTEKKAKEASNTAGGDAPGTEDPQAKLLEDGEHIKIQTVSYEVEEEEYVEYEVSGAPVFDILMICFHDNQSGRYLTDARTPAVCLCLMTERGGMLVFLRRPTLVSSRQRIWLRAWTFYQPQILLDPLTLSSIPHLSKIHR